MSTGLFELDAQWQTLTAVCQSLKARGHKLQKSARIHFEEIQSIGVNNLRQRFRGPTGCCLTSSPFKNVDHS